MTALLIILLIIGYSSSSHNSGNIDNDEINFDEYQEKVSSCRIFTDYCCPCWPSICRGMLFGSCFLYKCFGVFGVVCAHMCDPVNELCSTA